MKQTIKRSCFRLKQWALSLFAMLGVTAAWGEVQTTPIPGYPGAGYVRTGLGELGDEVAVVFTNTVEGAYYTAPGDLKNVQFLVVGGGGGGGGHYKHGSDKKLYQGGAGGGGGGVVTGIMPTISSGVTFTAVVGAGGSGGEATTTAEALQGAAENGGNSSFSITNVTYITAYGGGGDGGYDSTGGVNGGSNSGVRQAKVAAELKSVTYIGTGVEDLVSNVEYLRNKGGEGYGTSSGYPGSGGGGAVSAGGKSGGSAYGGEGGYGLESAITGDSLVYGAGGGGGIGRIDGANSSADESAGRGQNASAGTDAKTNQGGGGGGGSYLCAGGAGGSGIVAFRFIYFEGSIEVDPVDNILTKISDKYYTGDVLSSGIVSTPAYTVEELGERRHAGEYKVQVTLNDEYVWSDGFENKAREFSWKIMQEPNEWATAPSLSHTAWPQAQAQNIKFTAPTAKYGTLSTPTICKNGGEAEVFSGKLPTEPGTYTIKYEVIGNDDYAGRVWEQTFTIYRSTPIDGGYKVFGLGENKNEIAVVFTQNANWEVPKTLSNVEFLVVGGGGGGGAEKCGGDQSMAGAGGGGGGVVTGLVNFIDGESVTVTVGSGGKGGSRATKGLDSNYGAAQKEAQDSSFAVDGTNYVTAYRGGGDGGADNDSSSATGGLSGRSGGSSAGSRPSSTGQGTATQGSVDVGADLIPSYVKYGQKGGMGYTKYMAGGGGGAIEEGASGTESSGGKGGEGLVCDITGSTLVYGSGGGGGGTTNPGAVGGTGAGNGGWYDNATSALANQGGGGGGGGRDGSGGNGGSGIVAFRYVSTPIDNIIFKDEFEDEISAVISGQQFVYNGESQSALPDEFLNSAKYTIASNITATAAGTYTFTITPNEGCSWDDESLESKEFTWTIHPIDPSAGYVKEIGDEVVVAFTNHKAVATWVVPAKLRNVEFLVVGGGGGGGAENGGRDDRQGGAGGGGGSVVTGIVTKLESGSELSIKVGAGGGCGKSKTKYSSDDNSYGASGSGDSSYIKVGTTTYVNAPGGGGDGGSKWNSSSGAQGKTGGSSGGSRPGCSTVAAVTEATVDKDVIACYKAYGNTGGAGWTGGLYYGLYAAAGGGGGAGTSGYSATGNDKAGDGGKGLICSITGESVVYGSGGGGASLNGSGGGIGGEGAGDGNTEERDTNSGEDALPNQGGGGGGAAREGNGGNGGSGIVVFRYSKVQYVAQIGEVMYETLQGAVDAAEEGDTITLIDNVALETTLAVEKSITLDMGGNTVTADFTWSNDTPAAFWVKNGGDLTLTNGTLTATVEGVRLGVKQATDPATKGTLTIASDASVTSTADVGVMLYGGSTLTSSGTITSTSADYAAIQGNGLDTLESTINITGGTVTSESNHAIYHPQPGTLTISGGTISGVTGIEMRAGTLNMSGGVVTATGEYDEATTNNSGSTVEGAAIVLSQHSTGNAVAANITGGTITAGESGKTFVVANTTGAETAYVAATIAADVALDVSKAVVTIGSMMLVGDAENGYSLGAIVAEIGETKYPSFDAALAAAEAGQTITLLADVTCTSVPAFTKGGVVNVDINGNMFVSSDRDRVRPGDKNYIKFVSGFGWEVYDDYTSYASCSGDAFRVFPTLDEAIAYEPSKLNPARIYPYENVVQNKDVTLRAYSHGTSSTICVDPTYDIVWDLNGYTVLQENPTGNPLETYIRGKLTLNDSSDAKTGKWIAAACGVTDPQNSWYGSGGPAFIVYGDGELILNGGTVSIARNAAEIVNTGGLLRIDGGKMQINDGVTLEVEDLYGIMNWGGDVTVNGGTFNVDTANHSATIYNYGYYGAASATVNSYFPGMMYTLGTGYGSGANATVNVPGILYYADGTTTTFIAPIAGTYEGAQLIAKNDGFVVTHPDEVAVIVDASLSTEGYTTIESAIAAADDGDEIYLVADVELTADVTVDEDVTLNVGANTLTLPSANTITVAEGKRLAVTCGTGGLVVDGTIAVNGMLDVSDLSYGASGLIANRAGNLAIGATGSVKLMSVWDEFSPNWLATNSSAFFKDSVEGAKLVQGSGTYTYTDGAWLIENAVAMTQVTANGKTYQDGFATLQAAVDAADEGTVIKVIANVNTDAAIQVSKKVTVDLNGFKVATTQNDESGDGVFCVTDGGELTVEDSVGTGVVNGVGGNNYNIAVWANGGKVIINGGKFTNDGATDSSGDNTHFDLIYVKNGGSVEINGGAFIAETPAWTLNIYDAHRDTCSITVKGGTFYGFNPADNSAEGAGTDFCAKGYDAVEDAATGTWTVQKAATAVAKIGNVEYPTLAAACNAASEGATVQLIANSEENCVINEGFNGTIDLGGFTLTGRIYSKNATMTVKNGTVVRKHIGDDTSASNAAIQIDNGSLTLEESLVVETSVSHGIRLKGSATCLIKGGQYKFVGTLGGTLNLLYPSASTTSMTIDGGAFYGMRSKDVSSMIRNIGTVVINGGTFDSGCNNLFNIESSNGKIVVTGGDFSEVQTSEAFVKGSGGTVEYSGGTFYFNPTTVCGAASEGYEAVQDSETNLWTFAEVAPPVAQIGETKYATLQEACNAATEGAVVELITDTEENCVIDAGFNGTIDLGGYTLTGRIYSANATMTIKNGTVVRKYIGDDKSSSNAAIQIDNGSLILEENLIVETSLSHGVRLKGTATCLIKGGQYKFVGTLGGTLNLLYPSASTTSMTIDGGAFYGMKSSDVSSMIRNIGMVVINGGTFDSGCNNLFNIESSTGKIVVKGGDFSGIQTSGLFVKGANGTVEYFGGTFYFDPTTACGAAAVGYKAVQDSETKLWTIVEQMLVAPGETIEVSAADAAAALAMVDGVAVTVPAGATVAADVYAGYFKLVATLKSEGVYTVSAVLDPEVVTPTIGAIAIGDGATVTIDKPLPGLYYSVKTMAEVNGEAVATSDPDLAKSGDALTLTPAFPEGEALDKAFFKVVVGYTDSAASGNAGTNEEATEGD